MRSRQKIMDAWGSRITMLASGDDGFACTVRPNPINSDHYVQILRVIASWGGGWEHVSVSLPNRCPSWDEMEAVKRIFWRDDECAMQLHPALSQYVNYHPYSLHLWRPIGQTIPLPPVEFVGPPRSAGFPPSPLLTGQGGQGQELSHD